jgi:hypothetical protein
MEHEQTTLGLSLSPIDWIDLSDFVDELGLDDECIDNSNDNTIVFGLSW